MGKINWGRVFAGGLLAGVWLNVVDYVFWGVLYKDQFENALKELNRSAPTSTAIWTWVVLDFIFGIALVWLYAAIRPRFGAGPKTAACAGFFMWFIMGLLHGLSEMPMGLFPNKLMWTGIVVSLVMWIVGGLVGGWLYKEEA